MRLHSGNGRFARVGMAARAGIVASIIIVPVAVLSGWNDMQSAVAAARQQSQLTCTTAHFERQSQRSMTDGPLAGDERASGFSLTPAEQRCMDAGESAADLESRHQTFLAAERAIVALAALWLIGFIALRMWRWVKSGEEVQGR